MRQSVNDLHLNNERGLWPRACDRLREHLGDNAFVTWIRPLTLKTIVDSVATIEAPSRAFREWIRDRYSDAIAAALSAELGGKLAIDLTFAGTNAAPPRPCETRAVVLRDPPEIGGGENRRLTFAEFIVGPGNQFAHAAAISVANQPGENYNPLFIYGGVGLGKTHLLNAIRNQMLTRNPRLKVMLMPADIFMSEMVNAIRRDRMIEFRDRLRDVDALLLDDAQDLVGRERTQEEFLNAFNVLHCARRQIVLASDRAPVEMRGIEAKLRSRFGSGLIVDVAAPDLDTRIAIVRRKAERLRLVMEPDAAMYIAQHVSDSVRAIEGCLTRLAAIASFTKTAAPVSLETARGLLGGLVSEVRPKPGIEKIVGEVAAVFHVPVETIKSKKRTQHVCFTRQVAMYLCRELTGSSYPAIGEAFDRDHSTVIHAYNVIEMRVKADSSFRIMTIERLARALQQSAMPAAPAAPEFRAAS